MVKIEITKTELVWPGKIPILDFGGHHGED
jgi:hypothetical protein